MKSMITPIGGFYVVMGVMNGFIALMMMVYALFPAAIGVMAVSGAMKQEEGALPATIVMAATTLGLGGMGLLLGALGLAYIVDGVGILKRKRWSKGLGVLLALPVMTVCIPVGTLLGVFSLIVLLSQDATEEFSR